MSNNNPKAKRPRASASTDAYSGRAVIPSSFFPIHTPNSSYSVPLNSHSNHKFKQREAGFTMPDPSQHSGQGAATAQPSRALYGHAQPIIPTQVDLSDTSSNPTFEYGPTKLPPKSYKGSSPYDSRGTGIERRIPQSSWSFVSVIPRPIYLFCLMSSIKVPHLEARVRSVENAVQGYVDMIGNEALRNSRIPEPKDRGSGSRSSTRNGSRKEDYEEDSRYSRR